MVKETTIVHKLPYNRWIVGLLGLMLAACNAGASPVSTGEANTDSGMTTQVFEGLYASAPNMSSFVPCAMGELPGPGKGYWLVPNDEFLHFYENPTGITMGDIGGTYGPYDEFAIYVRFEGILSSESGKGYGHLGQYAGEVQVAKTLEASRIWVGSTNPQPRFIGCGG